MEMHVQDDPRFSKGVVEKIFAACGAAQSEDAKNIPPVWFVCEDHSYLPEAALFLFSAEAHYSTGSYESYKSREEIMPVLQSRMEDDGALPDENAEHWLIVDLAAQSVEKVVVSLKWDILPT